MKALWASFKANSAAISVLLLLVAAIIGAAFRIGSATKEAEVNGLERENRAQESQIEALNERLEFYRDDKIPALESESARLAEALSNIDGKAVSARKEAEGLTAQLSRLETENADLKARLDNGSTQVDRSVRELESKLAAARITLVEKDKKIATLERRMNDQRSSLQELKAENEALKKSLEQSVKKTRKDLKYVSGKINRAADVPFWLVPQKSYITYSFVRKSICMDSCVSGYGTPLGWRYSGLLEDSYYQCQVRAVDNGDRNAQGLSMIELSYDCEPKR